MPNIQVTSDLNSSNLKAIELMLRLSMITFIFWILISLNRDIQSKFTSEELQQFSVISSFCIVSSIPTRFFIRQPFFYLNHNFLNIMLEIEIFLIFLLIFISLFSLIVYLGRFN